MLLAQVFKEVVLSFFQAGREAWRRGGRALQVSVLVIVVGLVGIFAVKRYREAFSHEPPDWLQQKRFTSATLSKDAAADFLQSIDLADRYARQRGIPVGSVRMWEVQDDGRAIIQWFTDRFENPGYGELRNFERSFRLDATNFVGYYSHAAKPLDYSVKHSPTRTNMLMLTVHLPNGVAAGSNEPVFRLEVQHDRIRTNKGERLQLGLGRIPKADSAVHLWSIRLPENARLVQFGPEKGAEVSSNEVVRINWVNARMDASLPAISVVFECPR